MDNLIGLIAVVMVFSIPLTAIILGHLRGNQKLRAKMLKDELELEKLRGHNFIAETEKMRLELEKMTLDFKKTEDPILIELQKDKINV